jgi:putative nucleotidyltransferase with HDIG domain
MSTKIKIEELYNLDFDLIEKIFPEYIIPMKTCMQAETFHAEGDVFTHTKMVLNYLIHSHHWDKLSNEDKKILFLAALFHDIGKPYVSKEEDGVITSKKHASVGARIFRNMVWSDKYNDITFDQREEIANMIMLHVLPYYFIEKKDPLYSVSASSMVNCNYLLSILAEADMFGRIASDKIHYQSKETLEMFKDFCEECECYFDQLQFPSINSRFRYFFEYKGNPKLDYYEKFNGTAILMSGVQGSGKSTSAKKTYKNLPIIGLDQMREDMHVDYGDDEGTVAQNTKEECRVLMRDKKDFVFDATNTIKTNRANWIRLFRQYGYKIVIHYVEKDLESTLKNNKARDRVVPEKILLEKFERIDIPTKMECHELILEVKNDKDN